MRINLQEQLKNEANSQFHETSVRQEILTAGGADIGVSGIHSADYKRIYGEFRAGNITRAQAIDQMATAVGTDITSTDKQTYNDYYGKTYEKSWDEKIAPTRRGKP